MTLIPTLRLCELCPAHPSSHPAAVLRSRPLTPCTSRPYPHGNLCQAHCQPSLHPTPRGGRSPWHLHPARCRPLGLECHHQDPSPSGDLAWLLLAQSQQGNLLSLASPQTPLHCNPSTASLSHQGHRMRCHHGRPLPLPAIPDSICTQNTPPPLQPDPRPPPLQGGISHHHLPGQVTEAHTWMS